MNLPEHRRKKARAATAVALLAVMLLAGCVGGEDDAGPNRKPHAALDAGDASVVEGEMLAFDASASRDPDGSIVKAVYDFGDGTVEEYDWPEGERVEHRYEESGVYNATVTVYDDGGENATSRFDNATVEIGVHDRKMLAFQVAALLPIEDPAVRSNEMAFAAGDGSAGFDITLNITNDLPSGDSRMRIVVLDPDGNEVANETVTVAATSNTTLRLAGVIAAPGTYGILAEAEAGASTARGELLVLYGNGNGGSDAAAES